MERLWSPWRSQYISSFSSPSAQSESRCFLCDAVNGYTKPASVATQLTDDLPLNGTGATELGSSDPRSLADRQDAETLVVHRAEHCFVIMNRFPYNAGHLMVVPNEHIGDFAALQAEHATELMQVLRLCHEVLSELYHPHGFNIGANLGRVAGAGVPDHIHFHIVPRWNGDTNFMPVLADVRVASESLDTSYADLHAMFRRVAERS